MSDAINVESVKGNFAVITIRPDEYKAVLDRVTNRKVVTQGQWLYEYGTIETVNKEPVNISVTHVWLRPTHWSKMQPSLLNLNRWLDTSN